LFQLYRGDCLKIIRNLPAASVDAVVTDPPYGQSNEVYDGPIAASDSLWHQCRRVAKANAAIVSFAGSPTYHRIASAIERGGWRVRQMWAWVYTNGFITSAWPREGFDRLAPSMEPMCFATTGKVLLTLKREGGYGWKRDRNGVGRPGFSERASTHGKAAAHGHWPRNLVADAPGFQYFALNPNSPRLRAEKHCHPNQKPLALMDWIISKIVPPGGTVLDPFMGSGTTGVACLETGRRFIGIEIDPDYFKIARRRIRAAVPIEA
jgi:site-specific DNA-methyltransferase (adenine-specific)